MKEIRMIAQKEYVVMVKPHIHSYRPLRVLSGEKEYVVKKITAYQNQKWFVYLQFYFNNQYMTLPRKEITVIRKATPEDIMLEKL